ncbi:putative metalloprotease CJM1_0395 family protein [Paraglaciecola sp.]|uniref:putative metalloprotease CJM1_0395 family protein n=1 Tax=Paraglaciecola sp. TaxID=1920173 RepID=UPI0030F4016C
MNIIPPIPTAITFNNGVVNNEAARRENTIKETVPAPARSENSSAEKGLGSEFDRVKTPGQAPQPLTYERPQPNQNQTLDGQTAQKDNGSEQSAGREEAESRQQEQQQQTDDGQLSELKQRDQEVRSHEKAHAATGGQYAGVPQFEFKAGPDGRQYATDGEVSIDISEGSTPEETIRKMQQVKAAALAPAEPSPQDLRVAAEASQKSVEARNEIAQAAAEQAGEAFERAIPANLAESGTGAKPIESDTPSLSEIADNIEISVPTRTLEKSTLEIADNQTDEALLAEQIKLFHDNRDQNIVRRLAVIDNYYQHITAPRTEGFQQLA